MNYFLAAAGDELDLLNGQTRKAYLRFQAPNGDSFELPISESQLRLVLEKTVPTRSPTRPPAQTPSPPLQARGVVDEEPVDETMAWDDEPLGEEDEDGPLVLTPPGRFPGSAIDEDGL